MHSIIEAYDECETGTFRDCPKLENEIEAYWQSLEYNRILSANKRGKIFEESVLKRANSCLTSLKNRYDDKEMTEAVERLHGIIRSRQNKIQEDRV